MVWLIFFHAVLINPSKYKYHGHTLYSNGKVRFLSFLFYYPKAITLITYRIMYIVHKQISPAWFYVLAVFSFYIHSLISETMPLVRTLVQITSQKRCFDAIRLFAVRWNSFLLLGRLLQVFVVRAGLWAAQLLVAHLWIREAHEIIFELITKCEPKVSYFR